MKTIQQASQEYANLIFERDELDHHFEIAQDAFKAGIEYAQRWISVDDEMPPTFADILIKREGCPMHIGYYSSDGKFYLPDRILPLDGCNGFTYWRLIELK